MRYRHCALNIIIYIYLYLYFHVIKKVLHEYVLLGYTYLLSGLTKMQITIQRSSSWATELHVTIQKRTFFSLLLPGHLGVHAWGEDGGDDGGDGDGDDGDYVDDDDDGGGKSCGFRGFGQID